MHIKVRSRDGMWHGVSVASGEVKNDLNWMSNPKLGKVPSAEGGANLRLLGHGVIRQTGEKVVAAVLGQIESWLKDSRTRRWTSQQQSSPSPPTWIEHGRRVSVA
ncbi:hypothetical protein DIPPA_13371 [Diplonema papillatum]|nr:hypothetical protein DIPPA_13371 [Diplonema papillatum]